MAGIKITDLPALSVADSADYLVIVDVSDTSQSPAGTTKKIELANVATNGIFYPITNAVLSANVVSVGGGSYAQYFVSAKSMILGVFLQDLNIDFDASTDALIEIDLPNDTGYNAISASGSASISFSTSPLNVGAVTPVFSFCYSGNSGKILIKLQNYGGIVNEIYNITATFVIQVA